MLQREAKDWKVRIARDVPGLHYTNMACSLKIITLCLV